MFNMGPSVTAGGGHMLLSPSATAAPTPLSWTPRPRNHHSAQPRTPVRLVKAKVQADPVRLELWPKQTHTYQDKAPEVVRESLARTAPELWHPAFVTEPRTMRDLESSMAVAYDRYLDSPVDTAGPTEFYESMTVHYVLRGRPLAGKTMEEVNREATPLLESHAQEVLSKQQQLYAMQLHQQQMLQPTMHQHMQPMMRGMSLCPPGPLLPAHAAPSAIASLAWHVPKAAPALVAPSDTAALPLYAHAYAHTMPSPLSVPKAAPAPALAAASAVPCLAAVPSPVAPDEGAAPASEDRSRSPCHSRRFRRPHATAQGSVSTPTRAPLTSHAATDSAESAYLTKDSDGKPWAHACDRQRRLHRKASGGADDWILREDGFVDSSECGLSISLFDLLQNRAADPWPEPSNTGLA